MKLSGRGQRRKLRPGTLAIPGPIASNPYFFFEEDFFELFPDEDFFFGTFAPALRASDSPMAIACFRLVTFFPLRPLFSVPLFFSRMTRSTFSPAFGPYLLPDDFFFVGMQTFSLLLF